MRARALWWVAICLLVVSGTTRTSLAQSGTGTIRVAPTGSDAGGCGSVASPCQTLQWAVDEFAQATDGEILVAAGTYTSSAAQVVRITVGKHITMRGGYTTAFSSSDPDANAVVIDAQGARRGVLVDPTNGIRDPELTLIGVTLANGAAPTDAGVLNSFGGGLDSFQATVTVQDCKVTNNVARGTDASMGLPGDGAGGGLSFRQATGTVTDVELTGNLARGGDGSGTATRGGLGVGGAIFAFESTVTLSQVTASGNSARAGDAPASGGQDGGGQRADGLGGFIAWILSGGSASDLTAFDNTAQGGQASAIAGLGLGGAIFIEDADGTLALDSVVLRSNTATGGASGGGGGDRGGLGGGGGIFSTDSVITLDASTIISNTAQGGAGVTTGGDAGGAGIYMDSVLAQAAELTATNVIIGQNTTSAGSGATKGFAFGGGIFMQNAVTTNDATLTHATLAENVVQNSQFNQGAALFVGTGATTESFFGIVNGHTTPITTDDRGEAVLVLATGSATFNTTLWDGNTRKDFAVTPGGFVDNDPVDVTDETDFVAPGTTPPDYHILETSAAVDSALGSFTPTDVDGEPRPYPPLVGMSDLGADEFQPAPEPEAWLLGSASLLALTLLRLRRRASAPNAIASSAA